MAITPETFTTVYEGQTWIVDIAEAGPDYVIARSRHGGTVLFQAISYSKDPYTGSESWGFVEDMHTTQERARVALASERKTNAFPDPRLERIARNAIHASQVA